MNNNGRYFKNGIPIKGPPQRKSFTTDNQSTVTIKSLNFNGITKANGSSEIANDSQLGKTTNNSNANNNPPEIIPKLSNNTRNNTRNNAKELQARKNAEIIQQTEEKLRQQLEQNKIKEAEDKARRKMLEKAQQERKAKSNEIEARRRSASQTNQEEQKKQKEIPTNEQIQHRKIRNNMESIQLLKPVLLSVCNMYDTIKKNGSKTTESTLIKYMNQIEEKYAAILGTFFTVMLSGKYNKLNDACNKTLDYIKALQQKFTEGTTRKKLIEGLTNELLYEKIKDVKHTKGTITNFNRSKLTQDAESTAIERVDYCIKFKLEKAT